MFRTIELRWDIHDKRKYLGRNLRDLGLVRLIMYPLDTSAYDNENAHTSCVLSSFALEFYTCLTIVKLPVFG